MFPFFNLFSRTRSIISWSPTMWPQPPIDNPSGKNKKEVLFTTPKREREGHKFCLLFVRSELGWLKSFEINFRLYQLGQLGQFFTAIQDWSMSVFVKWLLGAKKTLSWSLQHILLKLNRFDGYSKPLQIARQFFRCCGGSEALLQNIIYFFYSEIACSSYYRRHMGFPQAQLPWRWLQVGIIYGC